MILFDEIIFGPVLSRRLGFSLGINLLPTDCKICTFNCIYCECGWTKSDKLTAEDFPPADKVISKLEERLIEMKADNSTIDSITFAGNGEPTLHPNFAAIIDSTIDSRNIYYPDAVITVLSNATLINDDNIIMALKRVDKNMLKLDAGDEKTFKLINNPEINVTLHEIIGNLKKFNGNLIIQSMFIKGEFNGIKIDNTEEAEVNKWLIHLKEIKPELVVIYSISRTPANRNIIKVSKQVLNRIAEKVKNEGINVEVYE
jgi:wyosine [tRNA(Phe)-imidazoG37] synthetase (radical SAM superfamily)